MGSLEEEKLLQMVRDFIESSDPKTSSSSSSSSSHNLYTPPTTQKNVQFLHSTRVFTLQDILRNNTAEEKEILGKLGKLMKNKMDLEKTSRLKKWLVKCLKLDGLPASLCHTSWVTTSSCPCGSYEYIEVVTMDHAKGGFRRLVMDIDFKSQFEVARPTQSYTDLLNKLPTIFVGSEDKLNRIISLLCSAAEESLKERGLHVPPWRRPTYMQSKWKLCNSTNFNKYQNELSIKNNNDNSYNNNNNNKFNANYPSRLEKWVPQNVMMKGRSRELGGGGSGLSNQFSNLSINCC